MWRVGSTYRVLSCGVSQCREPLRAPPPPIRGVRADRVLQRSRAAVAFPHRTAHPAYHINDCNLYANIASHGVANDVL